MNFELSQFVASKEFHNTLELLKNQSNIAQGSKYYLFFSDMIPNPLQPAYAVNEQALIRFLQNTMAQFGFPYNIEGLKSFLGEFDVLSLSFTDDFGDLDKLEELENKVVQNGGAKLNYVYRQTSIDNLLYILREVNLVVQSVFKGSKGLATSELVKQVAEIEISMVSGAVKNIAILEKSQVENSPVVEVGFDEKRVDEPLPVGKEDETYVTFVEDDEVIDSSVAFISVRIPTDCLDEVIARFENGDDRKQIVWDYLNSDKVLDIGVMFMDEMYLYEDEEDFEDDDDDDSGLGSSDVTLY